MSLDQVSAVRGRPELRAVASAWLHRWRLALPMRTETGYEEVLVQALDDLEARLAAEQALTPERVTELTGFTDRRVVEEILEDAARIGGRHRRAG